MTGLELPTVIAIASVATTAVTGAVGAVVNSRRQAASDDFNASIADRNAKISQQKAAFDEARARERALRLRGSQRAAFGKSGVTFEGTPLDLLEQTTIDSELEALSIRHGGVLQSQNFGIQANALRSRASSTRSSGLLSAGASLLGGLAKGASIGISSGVFGGSGPGGSVPTELALSDNVDFA